MLRLIFPLFLLLSGCASLDDVIGGISNTPEWFQKRRVEIRGEGYPSFSDVPADIQVQDTLQRIAVSESDTLAKLVEFLNSPRSRLPDLTEDQIDENARDLLMALPVPPVLPDALLTDEDIRVLHQQVQPPPLNLTD